MSSFESIGIKKIFNDSVGEINCTLKQVAFDFIVQEITPTRVCGISPILNYQKFLDAKEMLKTVNLESNDKEGRTDIHRQLKYYPFLKAKTKEGKIFLEKTDVDVYSFVLQKVMFNTIDAGKWICRRLNVPICSFKFAGNKDKRAVTFQEVTIKCSFMDLYKLACELNGIPDSFRWKEFIEEGYGEERIGELNERIEREISLMKEMDVAEDSVEIGNEKKISEVDVEISDRKENLECREVKRMKSLECDGLTNQERLRSSIKIFDIKKSSSKKMGDLKGNRFTVTLKNFNKKELVRNLEKGFLNYFGQQRFGNNLTNHEVGRSILERNYEAAVSDMMKNSKCHELYAAGKYEDALSLGDSTEKYILRCKMKGMKDRDIVFGLKRELKMLYLHSYQSFKFNNAINERAEKGMCVMKGDLVIVNDEVEVVENPSGFTIFDVVLKMERLEDKMLKGGYRKMVERAYDVAIEEHDDCIIAGFSLNSSCYATMALREVIGDSVLNKEKIKI